ncbi:MAG: SGNH/GDSL hydrolase family protein, partial [Gorillibacterium sp.]|nr:SGNH/GDSL hydrolase family protein [Gorillibacterium sp.]
MEQAVWSHRKSLSRTLRRIEEGKLTLGFIGGSITDPRPRHNWPEPVIGWFAETYPGLKLIVENAAIGATGSDLAVFRAKRDLIERGCDLVFVEYAVNDEGAPTDRRNRSREGLIRQLLTGEDRDLMLVYTYSPRMYESMISGSVPETIGEFEKIADHYGISSVWMGLYALNELKKGRLRWEEWLPDGLHPTSRGSLSYGQSVIHFLEQEMMRSPEREWDAKRTLALAEPLDPLNWGDVY